VPEKIISSPQSRSNQRIHFPGVLIVPYRIYVVPFLEPKEKVFG
jgi:hypothetical protein